ncbi:zinc finger and BTB domain-containing protein 24-like [Anopheles coustani]|uniref:zinc finger and BTB domain-containing protein 24-like n=1 Tax=Anopheles coustani TaxID=139045 RepID=UPI00265B428D|nr:zinc finger and BTB domain-containing protein 24-like [Anopheles coustani]
MASNVVAIGKICRYCLGQNALTLLSKTVDTAFSREDVEYCTGIKITNIEDITICHECCVAIKYAVDFRRTCLNNDIVFKKLANIINGSAKSNITITCLATGPAESAPQPVESPDVVWCDDDIIPLDNSESNDSTSQPAPNGNSKTVPRDALERPTSTEIEVIEIVEQLEVETLDGDDSDYSMPSLYGEAIQESMNNRSKYEVGKEKSTECSTESGTEKQSTGDGRNKQKNWDSSTYWSKRSSLPPDSDDSDDSIVSLYTEWWAKFSDGQDVVYVDGTSSGKDGLCSICGLKTANAAHHEKRRHNAVKKLVCPHCPKRFAENFYLKEHINTRHERRILFTCEECGKGFVSQSALFYHTVNSHKKNAVHECKTCHRKLKSWDGYNKHLKEHSLSALKCEDCGKLFKTMVTLEKHKLRYHAE